MHDVGARVGNVMARGCGKVRNRVGLAQYIIPDFVRGVYHSWQIKSSTVVPFQSSMLKQFCDMVNRPEMICHKSFSPEDTNILLPELQNHHE